MKTSIFEKFCFFYVCMLCTNHRRLYQDTIHTIQLETSGSRDERTPPSKTHYPLRCCYFALIFMSLITTHVRSRGKTSRMSTTTTGMLEFDTGPCFQSVQCSNRLGDGNFNERLELLLPLHKPSVRSPFAVGNECAKPVESGRLPA